MHRIEGHICTLLLIVPVSTGPFKLTVKVYLHVFTLHQVFFCVIILLCDNKKRKCSISISFKQSIHLLQNTEHKLITNFSYTSQMYKIDFSLVLNTKIFFFFQNNSFWCTILLQISRFCISKLPQFTIKYTLTVDSMPVLKRRVCTTPCCEIIIIYIWFFQIAIQIINRIEQTQHQTIHCGLSQC